MQRALTLAGAIGELGKPRVRPNGRQRLPSRESFVRTRLLIFAALLGTVAVPSAQTDLDAFMSQVLARRDDNWKKLQQYVLDEDETFQITGPDARRLYGSHREYTWFTQDGVFIRSPVKADGVTIPEADRRKAEERWLREQQGREKRRNEREQRAQDDAEPPSLDDLVKRGNEPGFVSNAYFMRFKFEPGHYALVGRERLLDRDVLRIEYYPAQLFNEGRTRPNRRVRERDERVEEKMNKVALVTLWIEPTAHQILQYEFRNVGFDFLPGRWLARIDDLRATMRMGQAFPNVWLPDTIGMRFAMTLAIGAIDGRYDVRYHDYREATVRTRVR
jgi:hypothetical protein